MRKLNYQVAGATVKTMNEAILASRSTGQKIKKIYVPVSEGKKADKELIAKRQKCIRAKAKKKK